MLFAVLICSSSVYSISSMVTCTSYFALSHYFSIYILGLASVVLTLSVQVGRIAQVLRVEVVYNRSY